MTAPLLGEASFSGIRTNDGGQKRQRGGVDDCPNDPLNHADGDGVCGDIDNCPDDHDAEQTNTDVTVNPPGDSLGDVCDPDDDDDGWQDDDEEAVITTDPLDNCTDERGDSDAWPPDMAGHGGCGDPDAVVNILDVTCCKLELPPNPYDPRHDLDVSGEVNILDVLLYKVWLGESCMNP